MQKEELPEIKEQSRSWKHAAAEQLVREYDPADHVEMEGKQLFKFGPFTVTHSEHLTVLQCNCPYPDISECHHIIATRQILTSSSQAPSPSAPPSSENTQSFRTLIHSIPESDLRHTVKEFASKNRSFKFLIRARYMDRAGISLEENKYLLLYNEIIHQRKTPSSPLAPQDMKVFRLVTTTLIDKSREAIVLKDYTHAFQMLFAAIDRLSLVMYRTPKQVERLLPTYNLLHDLLEELISSVEAPDLIRFITTKLTGLATKLYYQYWEFEKNIARLLPPTLEEEDIHRLLEGYLLRLPIENEEELRINTLGAALFIAHLSQNTSPYIPKLCEATLEHGAQYLNLAQKLHASGKGPLGSLVLYAGMSIFDNMYYYQQSLRFLPQIDSSPEDFTSLLLEGLRHYPTLAFLDKVNPSPSLLLPEKIHAFLQATPMDATIKIRLYQCMGALEAALKLCEPLSLSELSKIDAFFWEHSPKVIADIYISKLEQYLEAHLGPAAQAFVHEILTHISKQIRQPLTLRNIGRKALLSPLLKKLIQAHT